MNHRIILSILLSVSICTSVYPYSHFNVSISSERPSEILDAVCAAGAVVVGGYGLYKIGKWLFTPSDEQVIAKAHKAYERYTSFYQPMLQLTANPYLAVENVDEHLLYALATAKLNNAYIKRYVNDLRSAIKDIQSLITTLQERMQSHPNVHSSNMASALYMLCPLLDELNVLYLLLQKHHSYFVLYEQESDMWSRYARELETTPYYYTDYGRYKRAVQGAIMYWFGNEKYPYYSYLNHIDKDIDQLHTLIANTSGYADRLYRARELYNNLLLMRETVLLSNEYRQELWMYEQEQRDIKQLELQERKVQALEAQAYFPKMVVHVK